MSTIAEAIRSSYIFSNLAPEQIEKIIALASEKAFDGGAPILRQFAKDSDVLVLIEGKARINTFSGDLIAEVGAGASIGEMALVDDKPRSATVVAMGMVRVALISRNALYELMESDPLIGKTILHNIAKILTERLRRANVDAGFAGSK